LLYRNHRAISGLQNLRRRRAPEVPIRELVENKREQQLKKKTSPRGWRSLNSVTPFGVAYPLRFCFLQRVGPLTLLFSCSSRIHRNRSTALIAVRSKIPTWSGPSFSTIRCKTLNIFIKVCHSLPCILALNPEERQSILAAPLLSPVVRSSVFLNL